MQTQCVEICKLSVSLARIVKFWWLMSVVNIKQISLHWIQGPVQCPVRKSRPYLHKHFQAIHQLVIGCTFQRIVCGQLSLLQKRQLCMGNLPGMKTIYVIVISDIVFFCCHSYPCMVMIKNRGNIFCIQNGRTFAFKSNLQSQLDIKILNLEPFSMQCVVRKTVRLFFSKL